ncbi:TfuA-like protein [Amycolatopsis sp. NPDC059090]|uniref:TfuA-like protein n=1 Tax=unclassified Amycolatopsis TaxID=2618356 RepID=UPI00366AF08C
MTAVVFCGPSIAHTAASKVLEAEYLPPVGKGDIDRLLDRPQRPTMIGIVDGRFLHSLSISPKEILRAMDADIAVYGSSSMGALRGAECAPYGMIGVGKIFEEFVSGRTDEDDEVAITYSEDTLRPLSEPLVNLRFAIAEASRSGVVSAELADRFLQTGKKIYFPERSVAAVLYALRDEVPRSELDVLAEFLRDKAPDTKREDAVALLERMRDDLTVARA